PYSKHLHVITSVPNVFFSRLKKPVPLDPINFEEEGIEKFGAADFEDFTWKQLLDAYTCTECGRCTSVCPANQTGKELNPKVIITSIRDRMMDKAPLVLNAKPSEAVATEKSFLGGYESEEALWACTSCGACMEECPVMIEHVPAIIDMRRSLVMMESRFPEELQTTFRNLENNFTPWAFPSGERAQWAEGKNIKTMAEDPNDYDVLFWVGCAGSFDARYKKVTEAFSELLNAAGIRFRILGNEEKCTGDPARRAGNEYLAQMLMKENIETLNRYHVTKIVTSCPHCMNILLNEYPQFGGKYEVIHHTEFIEQLIRQGKLTPSSQLAQSVTFHDPCYLGRHNEEYDAPRNDLKKIPGTHLTEMPRSKDKSFCCGAGGARMFMEEKVGKRVNIERTEEAIATGATTIAAACPFCMTMLTDGVKAKDKIEEIAVKDIAELVLESVRPSAPAMPAQATESSPVL
ncbi:MAG TPA: (Fe-S)-binding protein, partial [Candidatus Kapabacteria bacterium]|nr:(Fe-S)-binding protein [Candidatus Kapabacteria bacterium]